MYVNCKQLQRSRVHVQDDVYSAIIASNVFRSLINLCNFWCKLLLVVLLYQTYKTHF